MQPPTFWLGPAPRCVRSADQPWSGASPRLPKPCSPPAVSPALSHRPCPAHASHWQAMVKSMAAAAAIPHFHFCEEVQVGSPGLACHKLLLVQLDRAWTRCSSSSSCGACRQAARTNTRDGHARPCLPVAPPPAAAVLPACLPAAATGWRSSSWRGRVARRAALLRTLHAPCRPSRRPALHSACPQHLQSSPPPFFSPLPSGGPAGGASAAAA